MSKTKIEDLREVVKELADISGEPVTFDRTYGVKINTYWLVYKGNRISPKLKYPEIRHWIDGAMTFVRLK